VNNPFAASAREYRAAIRRHDWPDNPERVLRMILEFSHDCGRPRALIPVQMLFQELCGKMTKARVSECLEWLEQKKVIERSVMPVSYGGRRRRWTVYTLLPPEKWIVPERVLTTQRVQGLENWLAQLDPGQSELIAPPQSLNDLLVEDFVERAGTLPGPVHEAAPPALPAAIRVESAEQRPMGSADRVGSPERGFGGVETKSRPVTHERMVPPEGTKVEPEALESPAKVPSGGTSLVPLQGTNASSPAGNLTPSSTRGTRLEKESTNNSSVPREKVPRQGTIADFVADPYIREKLQRAPGLCRELVDGESESDGRRSMLKQWFGELYERNPDIARELLATSISKASAVRWLNKSVRVELGMERPPERRAQP
jgi:hypothetical protein